MANVDDLINDLENSDVGADARSPLGAVLNELNTSSAAIEPYLNAIMTASTGPEVLDAIVEAVRALYLASGGSGDADVDATWAMSYPDAAFEEEYGDFDYSSVADDEEDDS